MKKFCIAVYSCICCCSLFAQQHIKPKGNLFIIGGGTRTPELMQALLQTAQLSKKDYAVVLPMSSEEGDSAYYFKQDYDKQCSNTIANLNFTKATVNNKQWLDSVEHAKIIFITGGDQNRFMKIVLNTPVYKAIHDAYANGATVGGSSAGAAVMCKHIITGNQLQDTVYASTFDKLITDNIEFAEGMGLVDSVIIDQHFIVRSRYNRLLSALYAYPNFTCIGINESTAIIIHDNLIKVTGKSQVVVLNKPEGLTSKNQYIKMNDLHFAIYTTGDSFKCSKI